MLMRVKADEDVIIRLKALLSYQYGLEAGKALEGRKVEVEFSPATGRIRKVYVDGKYFGSIRASDGYLLVGIEGAKLLLKHLPSDRYRVVVARDAAPFIARGRTVFCKHVLWADPEIRAGDEVFVVDEKGRLLAVGRATLSGLEMSRSVKRGVCVKNRKSVGDYSL